MVITKYPILTPPVNRFTEWRDVLRQCGRTSDGWSALAWMEKIVRKTTNDTSKLACTTQDRELRDDELASRALAENELAHVSGGVFTVSTHMRRIFT
jgi:hypothetical protein